MDPCSGQVLLHPIGQLLLEQTLVGLEDIDYQLAYRLHRLGAELFLPEAVQRLADLLVVPDVDADFPLQFLPRLECHRRCLRCGALADLRIAKGDSTTPRVVYCALALALTPSSAGICRTRVVGCSA